MVNLAQLVAVRSAMEPLSELGAGWDGYKAAAISSSTVEVTLGVLSGLTDIANRRGVRLPLPDVTPNVDGSIDAHWETGKVMLLMNVTADEWVGCYGQGVMGSDVGAKFALEFPPSESVPEVVAWLTK